MVEKKLPLDYKIWRGEKRIRGEMRSFTIRLNLWHGLHQRYVINQRAKLFYLCICGYHNSSDMHLQIRTMAFCVICNIFLILPIPSFLFSFFFQYARIVREALCELELPYILQNVGEGSLRSKILVDASGSKEVRVW